jgi:N-acetyl-anhydromuramyl-L-alanine amidase AmpD
MPGVVIGDAEVVVPGLVVSNWNDDPKLRLRVGQGAGSDGRARKTSWVRSIVLHTTKGIPGGKDRRPQQIRPGMGPPGPAAEAVARYWASSELASGAHLVCDFDGSWICLADLATEAAYHATSMNDVSIGIEICQGAAAELYEGQLDSVVVMVDFLTARFGIQRQIPHAYVGPVPRLEAGGADCVGVFGHRDQTGNRGAGDPGDHVMARLADAGYERFDFTTGEDLRIWRDRQQALARKQGAAITVDGVPGPRTTARLREYGYPRGLWSGRELVKDRLRDELGAIEQRFRAELTDDEFRGVVGAWLA